RVETTMWGWRPWPSGKGGAKPQLTEACPCPASGDSTERSGSKIAVEEPVLRRMAKGFLPRNEVSPHQLSHIRPLRNPQAPVHNLNEPVGHHADINCGQGCNAERRSHRKADRKPLFAFFRLPHEHRVSDLQVVIKPENRVQHAQRS